VILFACGSPIPIVAAQPFEKAWAAYQRGEYAEALEHFVRWPTRAMRLPRTPSA
jgi:hypothetical protein